jgi:uncharacterized protein YjgD (DUF1641 family)
MAKSIRVIERKVPTEEEIREESLQDILKAISENRKAIVSFLEILKEVEAAGLLDFAQGVMKNRRHLESIGFDFIRVANVPVILKNVILATQFLGKQDPKNTEKLIKGITKGMENAAESEEDKPKSIWGLMGLMRDPQVMSALSSGLHFLQGMGAEMNRKEDKPPAKAPV